VAFDLETSSLNADFGVILCAAVWNSSEKKIKLLTQRLLSPKWGWSSHFDYPVVRALLEELDAADFWVAHNGRSFDVPFLNTRAAHWNLPAIEPRLILDPCIAARRLYRMSSNSLAALTKFLVGGQKSAVEPHDWQMAALARDDKAMRHIERHCVRDVELLIRLAPHFRKAWKMPGYDGAFR
jgi:uncharacterized protein YprB with RNaseH-like and TPR domain